jgi:diguanylate cyclase (GGDEF)-like protein
MRLSLFAKFLLLLVPLFVVLATLGIGVARGIEARDDSEDLAARVGMQAGRIAAALTRHQAADQVALATDLMGAFASESAVQCAELLDAQQRRRASYPAVVGCTAQAPEARIDLPVGEDEAFSLQVGYSTAGVAKQGRRRTLVAAGVVSAAFVVTMLSAGLGFRLIVSRRLERLHHAITRAGGDGAARVRAAPCRSRDELGDIVRAYNALLDREDARETALREAHARLQEQSRRDPLTGAYNRRHVHERLGARKTGPAAGAALALFDIDHFKRINDRHGHGVGDEVLVEVVRRIERVVGPDDLFARWGGEEFLLCVGALDAAAGLDGLARRLLGCLVGEPVPTSAGPLAVTVSIGVVALPLQSGGVVRAWADAVAVADWGLYQAKAAGRACAVIVAADGGDEEEGAPSCLSLCGGPLGVRAHPVRIDGPEIEHSVETH